ncbi:transcriptional repressor LexA [Patescibacteria group bacterium]|nr:transcriptional repressor LexA [Patescibacteria group bacterium]MBU1967171.1 transcriptional repressor LexA [Patescibacteria group bacterium]MBU2543319.1 transcriptional repressor LexA [Patescibacteria group bacterium]
MAVILYKRQRQILDFIAQYIQQNGYAPTLQEIANAIGVSSLATVHEHLQALERKKVIKRFDGQVRGIELLDRTFLSNEGIDVPIMGYIAAGKPIEPYSDPDATFKVSPEMISGKKRAYVLQVKGQSMIEDHIDDGDYVVVEETQSVEDGDIVVALLDNGLATLKRFYKEVTRVRLEPANANMSPIYATNVQIQGRVVGLIRKFQY